MWKYSLAHNNLSWTQTHTVSPTHAWMLLLHFLWDWVLRLIIISRDFFFRGEEAENSLRARKKFQIQCEWMNGDALSALSHSWRRRGGLLRAGKAIYSHSFNFCRTTNKGDSTIKRLNLTFNNNLLSNSTQFSTLFSSLSSPLAGPEIAHCCCRWYFRLTQLSKLPGRTLGRGGGFDEFTKLAENGKICNNKNVFFSLSRFAHPQCSSVYENSSPLTPDLENQSKYFPSISNKTQQCWAGKLKIVSSDEACEKNARKEAEKSIKLSADLADKWGREKRVEW